MDAKKEILDAIEIIVDEKMRHVAQIHSGVIKSANNGVCSVLVNGDMWNNVKYYGDAPTLNLTYPVFVPSNNMTLAFIIN